MIKWNDRNENEIEKLLVRNDELFGIYRDLLKDSGKFIALSGLFEYNG